MARGARGFCIPGTHLLADVAAEDLAADGGAEFFGDGPAFFDGEVGDAAAGVHLARRDKGVSRTGLDAAAAGTAAVGGRRGQHGGRDLERGDDAAEKEHRSVLLVESAGVFGGPADAGPPGEIALDQRAGVDVGAGFEGSPDAVVELGFEGAGADD